MRKRTIRLTATDTQTNETTNFFGWKRITNIQGKISEKLIVPAFKLNRDKTYRIEAYLDNADNIFHSLTLKVLY